MRFGTLPPFLLTSRLNVLILIKLSIGTPDLFVNLLYFCWHKIIQLYIAFLERLFKCPLENHPFDFGFKIANRTLNPVQARMKYEFPEGAGAEFKLFSFE